MTEEIVFKIGAGFILGLWIFIEIANRLTK
jgi:hypothetical protein